LEAADILPGAIFASMTIPVGGTIAERLDQRRQWFETVQHTLAEADLVFLDPDNGLEPAGHSPGSAKAGKSILLSELRALATPGRCLIVYHHQTRRQGGHHAEIEHWADRLRECGFTTVGALRAKPYSPRVFFLLDAPVECSPAGEADRGGLAGMDYMAPGSDDGGQRAYECSGSASSGSRDRRHPTNAAIRTNRTACVAANNAEESGRRRSVGTTQVGYVNRNGQEVIRPTGKPGTDHGQYVYVLKCRTCCHEYGANGSDIFQRRCPNHDGSAPGLDF